MEHNQKNFEALVKKIETWKNSGQIDLSKEEDLTVAVMNLISLEEHFFFSAEKTGKPDYFDWLKEIREIRKTLLAKLVNKHEGETWCVSKHLLAASMRLIEVGAKLNSLNKQAEAKEAFDQAYKIYSIFWGIRLKLIELKDLNEAARAEKPWTLQDIVNKLVDCCDE